MLPALVFLRAAQKHLGDKPARALLGALFILGSALPPFQALLPRDPAARFGAVGQTRAQPVMWFPLAYTLTGLPATGWLPGEAPASQVDHQAPARESAVVTAVRWNDPALPATALLWLAPLALLDAALLLRGLRPRAPVLSTLDPPPRPGLASA